MKTKEIKKLKFKKIKTIKKKDGTNVTITRSAELAVVDEEGRQKEFYKRRGFEWIH